MEIILSFVYTKRRYCTIVYTISITPRTIYHITNIKYIGI